MFWSNLTCIRLYTLGDQMNVRDVHLHTEYTLLPSRLLAAKAIIAHSVSAHSASLTVTPAVERTHSRPAHSPPSRPSTRSKASHPILPCVTCRRLQLHHQVSTETATRRVGKPVSCSTSHCPEAVTQLCVHSLQSACGHMYVLFM